MFGLKTDKCVIVTLDRNESNIGRHTDNHIIINSLPVSRHHSCIVQIDGKIFIKDKNTINGTFIGKHKILPDRETLLKIGDKIGIGCRANDNPQCTFEVVRIESQLRRDDTCSFTDHSVRDNSTPDSSTDRTVKRKTESCDLNNSQVPTVHQPASDVEVQQPLAHQPASCLESQPTFPHYAVSNSSEAAYINTSTRKCVSFNSHKDSSNPTCNSNVQNKEDEKALIKIITENSALTTETKSHSIIPKTTETETNPSTKKNLKSKKPHSNVGKCKSASVKKFPKSECKIDVTKSKIKADITESRTTELQTKSIRKSDNVNNNKDKTKSDCKSVNKNNQSKAVNDTLTRIAEYDESNKNLISLKNFPTGLNVENTLNQQTNITSINLNDEWDVPKKRSRQDSLCECVTLNITNLTCDDTETNLDNRSFINAAQLDSKSKNSKEKVNTESVITNTSKCENDALLSPSTTSKIVSPCLKSLTKNNSSSVKTIFEDNENLTTDRSRPNTNYSSQIENRNSDILMNIVSDQNNAVIAEPTNPSNIRKIDLLPKNNRNIKRSSVNAHVSESELNDGIGNEINDTKLDIKSAIASGTVPKFPDEVNLKQNSTGSKNDLNLSTDLLKTAEYFQNYFGTSPSNIRCNSEIEKTNCEELKQTTTDKLTMTIKRNTSGTFTVDSSARKLVTPANDIPCINLIDEDEDERIEDIKPDLPLLNINANYSVTDEIVLLDSDDEDFPSSQLNTTQIADIPDFSSTFESLYDYTPDVNDDDESQILYCNDVTWFKPLSVDGKGNNRKNLIVDLPIIPKQEPRDDISTSKEKENSMDVDVLITEIEENVCSDHVDGHGDASMLSDQIPNDLSKIPKNQKLMTEAEGDENQIHELTKKYLLKPCVVRLPVLNYNFEGKSSDYKARPKIKRKEKNLENKKLCNTENKIHSPLSSKKREQMLRKEKLKKVAELQKKSEKEKSQSSEKHNQPVLIKLTHKNRSSHLLDSIVCNPGNSKAGKKKAEINISAQQSAPKLTFEVDNNIRKNLVEVEKISDERDKIYDPYSSYHHDVNADRNILDVDLQKDGSEKTSENALQPLTTTLSNSNILKDVSNSESNEEKTQNMLPKQNDLLSNSSNIYHNLLDASTSDFILKGSASLSDNLSVYYNNSMAQTDSSIEESSVLTKLQNCQIFNDIKYREIEKTEKKSNLKSKIEGSTPFKKKRVLFHSNNEYKCFDADPEERLNNSIFAPAYKLNEGLIREEVMEFEAAIATVCKWNVKWLEEQQKNFAPPPDLYKPIFSFAHGHRLFGEYKERLKSEMFLNVWKAIFNSWNKPNVDFLPHTQFLGQSNKIGLCTLQIESVDTNRPGSLWTIYASRNISSFDCSEEIINGQIVILSFYVKQIQHPVPRKTMVFAYVASVNDTHIDDGSRVQRIIFKIHQKEFIVIAGEVKTKTLTYTKTQLRPFQALAMMAKSPIVDMFIDPKSKILEQYFKYDENLKDVFLDLYQKKAIIMCLNSLISAEPTVCLVDGAPGTGKSQVIVSLLHELFSKNHRHKFSDSLKVLVVTSSDNVADDITYRIEKTEKSDQNINLLRYGNCKNVHRNIRYCTVDDKIQDLIRKDDGKTLINLEEEKHNLKAKRNSVKLVLASGSASEEKLSDAKIKLAALNREYAEMKKRNSKIEEQLKVQAAKEIAIGNADVIVTSVHSCWSSNFEIDFVPSQYNKGDIHKFSICIFDDANYINETGMLIPFMLMVPKLILIGDSMNPAYADQSNTSPYQRLVCNFQKRSHNSFVKLNVQHRMHPGISAWLNDFYRLGIEKKIVGFKISLNPLFVFNLIGCDLNLKNSCWWEPQAVFCVNLLRKIIDIEKDLGAVSVIVVREEQRASIKDYLHRSGFEKPRKIRVDMLEQFTGREDEVVILCLPLNYKQFDKWLYVASSRAKSSLIVCGYFAEIEGSSSISSLTSYAKLRNVYASCYPETADFPSTLFQLNTK